MGKRMSIEGKRVLVTGGARGMGLLWVKHFLADKAKVAIWDRTRDALDEASALLASEGHSVYAQAVDVTDEPGVLAAASQLHKEFGHPDVVVNNAGIVAAGPFESVPYSELARTVDVNLKAVMLVSRVFLPKMIETNSGWLINVSSASGFIGVPYMPAYAASKWGVIGFSDSIRLELKVRNISGVGVSLFCPSYVTTGMFNGAKAPALTPFLSPEEAVDRAYRAFRRGTFMIREPLMVKFTPALRAILPMSVFDSVAGALGVTNSMEEWKGHK